MNRLLRDIPSPLLETGHVCLEFANTVHAHGSAHPEEMLLSYEDLLDWVERVGLLGRLDAGELRRLASGDPALAEHARQEAVSLREAIYHLFVAAARGQQPVKADLDRLNQALAEAMRELKVGYDKGQYAWLSEPGRGQLHSFLPRIARSAADLLTSDELGRVGVCADENGCGWLFFDTSRNHSRRWCDISSCGNRAKARRHYARSKTQG